MSWREVLGWNQDPIPNIPTIPTIHGSSMDRRGSEDCGDNGVRDGKTETHLLERLAKHCRGTDLKPSELKDALSPKDIEDWMNDALGASRAGSLRQGPDSTWRDGSGETSRPLHRTRYLQALWTHLAVSSEKVLGCPWCLNRRAGRPIPRPEWVCCSDCEHFNRTEHPRLGHCSAGEPEPLSGLWDTTKRPCARWIPREEQ